MRGKPHLVKEILTGLLVGGLVLVALSSPSGTRRLLKAVGREFRKREERKRFLWTVAYLRRKEYIEYHADTDGTIKIVLSEAGKKRALRYNLDTLTLPRGRSWDGKWHIVAFDIPEKRKAGRDALREKMDNLGMVQLQKSIWAWPYGCRDEIDFIAELFEVGPYVHYIVADSITSEKFLKYKFNLV